MSKITKKLNRIMLTGTGSGCGKTTVTCAVLKALADRKRDVCSFKCGPDYIDPMFHSRIIGTSSRNLDLFLCGENTVKFLLAECSGDLAVMEGVMGIYDGLGFEDDRYSANHISRVTETPEILICNVRGKSLSLLAELSGYLNFAPNQVKGVILNGCSKGMYPTYRKMIEENLPVKVYGYLPLVPEAKIGSRHLGLVTADEIDDLKEKVAVLGSAAAESLDLDGIEALAETAPAITACGPEIRPVTDRKPKIAVARDRAFCFYYEDNLRLFEKLGAALVFFSPLEDKRLPSGISGLYLGGGYPEEFLPQLSGNENMCSEIRAAVKAGIPVFAECGGFMYLGESIEKDGAVYPMVGAVSGNFRMTESLVRFGYKTLTADRDNLMCSAGNSIRCHEFHYSDTDCYGDAFTAVKGRQSWKTVQANETVFAGYPHLHLWGNLSFAERFVQQCARWGDRIWR